MPQSPSNCWSDWELASFIAEDLSASASPERAGDDDGACARVGRPGVRCLDGEGGQPISDSRGSEARASDIALSAIL